jgi:putative ABC transport system permease protein
MVGIAQRLEADYPEFDKNWTVNVEPLRDSLVSEVKPSLLVLLGAVGLLLAVACANVANLLTARYTSRAREIAIRLSLGAARTRVIRQLLTESILLGLTGGLLGIGAARLAVKGLLALAPRDLARNASIAVDLRVLGAALLLAILTGVLFGLAPALVGSSGGLIDRLRSGDRSSTGGGRLRAWLVGAEVALSLILLVGASLLFQSFIGLQAVNPGLDPANVLTFRVQIPGARYPKPENRTSFYARAQEQIAQLPGVRSASAVSFLPFTPIVAGTSFEIAGRPPARPGEQLVANIRTVLPGYFRTLGIPLQAGRDFTAADNDRAAPIRFIVNEAFVKQFLGSENALQSHISVAMAGENPFGEIVGVVSDVKEGSLDKTPAPTVYYNHAHLIYTSMTFVVRGQGSPNALVSPIRGVIHNLDSELPVGDIRPMQLVIGETYSRTRFSALLLSGFSIASLVLAAIGIYGMLAYSVNQRTREIGVRVALGAEPGRIMALIVGSGARLVAGGVVAGAAGALAATRLLEKLLFGVKARDSATFLIAPLVLAAVALLAAYIPARRAAKLQPMDALRSE